MIYVPMLKTKPQEVRVSKDMNEYFSENIIPLFEILTDKYDTKYKLDPNTKEFIYEQKGKRKTKIKELPTDEDIITLEYYADLMKDKSAFIEFFRFTFDKYGKNININKAELAWKLSNDEILYKRRIMEISKYKNLIPVVSIKLGFDMGKNGLQDFLNKLQIDNSSIALRISEEWLDKYNIIIKNILRSTDYLLFDIGEQSPESKIMELEEVADLNIRAKVILLNSPRKVAVKNSEYEERGITSLINNSARDECSNYEFNGYGDYCGLKDNLQTNGGSNGKGAALALIYDYKKNSFYSYLNPDTSQSMRGYYKLIPMILEDRNELDPLNDCPAIKKVQNLESCGSWSTWHNINITRYIYQIYKNI